ncbi:MAG: RnfABCDGE type electron transport complex subunit G [Candidatus Aureabacteria bacterium]|nr:RnfABCDGE type electron transport complex subunit G [Candidatus Auribacterota bacterium]
MADQDKKTTGIFRSSLTLFLITASAAFLLAFVYTKTKDKIAQTENSKKMKSYEQIFPKGRFSEEKIIEDMPFVEVSTQEGNPLGYIIFTQGEGYSSTIKIAYGITMDKKVKGVIILSQQETPGLGARAGEVKKNITLVSLLSSLFNAQGEPQNEVQRPWFQKQYENLSLEELWLKKQNENGKIEAITGATITSNAVTQAVRESLEQFIKNVQEKEHK